MDKNLSTLLKWGVENSAVQAASADASADSVPAPAQPSRLNEDVLRSLLGGPSDADLMKAAVEHITSSDPEITLESKVTAFDNLEQLIESIDNANNLSTLGLWTPLLDCLGHDEDRLRLMAAWCIGTAVQNNEPCQERLLAMGGVERLVRMALGERLNIEQTTAGSNGKSLGPEVKDVRKKAVYALSSAVRNYQPALDVCTSQLAKLDDKFSSSKVDATDMDAVDSIILELRERAANT